MGRLPSYGLQAVEAVKETVYGMERGCGAVAVGQVANLSYAVAMTGLGTALVVDQTLWPKGHSVRRAIGPSHGLQAVVVSRETGDREWTNVRKAAPVRVGHSVERFEDHERKRDVEDL